MDVTVNLKDLRAMVAFCESVELAALASARGPVLARPTAESLARRPAGRCRVRRGHGGYDNHHDAT